MASRAALVPVLTAAAVCALGFAIYWPALTGPFVSDDLFYVAGNPFVQSLSFSNAAAILDPSGEPAVQTLNYAPVHLFGHALEWRAFGPITLGYHVVNLLLHVVTSGLLGLLLLRVGLAPGLAAFGAAFFFVHPANVQAVAWIFQLKTVLSTALGLAALLLFERRPGFALALFVAALLTKISAASFLPALVVWRLCGAPARRPGARETRWLLAWTLAFLLASVPVWGAIEHAGMTEVRPYADAATGLRTVVAIALRYLVMAATGVGVSAFQEPARVTSFVDPWFVGGALALVALAWRALDRLRARDPEALFWALALGAWIPISQVVPFRYSVGDHYLYPILPGLIGGALLACQPALRRALDSARADRAGVLRRRTAYAAAGLVLIVFAGHAHARAGLWVSAHALSSDAASHYPDGHEAHRLRLYAAAKAGDAAAAARELDGLRALGASDFGRYLSSPAYASVRDAPVFRAAVESMARVWTERAERGGAATQLELSTFSNAYYVVGDLERSIAWLERAVATPGPATERLARELDARRLEARLRARRGTAPRVAPDR